MTTTQKDNLKKKITEIIESPSRARFETADIRVGMMSSTTLSEKVDDISALFVSLLTTINEELDRERKDQEIHGRGMISAIEQADAEYHNKIIKKIQAIITRNIEEI